MAVKRLMASFYGIVAFQGFGWANVNLAASITASAREAIRLAAFKAKELEYETRGRKCRFKNCETRIIGEPMSMGEDSPMEFERLLHESTLESFVKVINLTQMKKQALVYNRRSLWI